MTPHFLKNRQFLGFKAISFDLELFRIRNNLYF